MSDAIVRGLLAAGLAFVLTPVARSVARRLSVIDVPNDRSSHVVPTPRIGGYAIVGSILAALATSSVYGGDVFGFVLASAVALGLLAAWDEIRPIPTAIRFTVQLTVVVVLVVWAGVRLPDTLFSGAAEPAPRLSILVTVLWVTWAINAYNFMDGINGIASIQAIVCGLVYGLLFWRAGDQAGVLLSVVIAGSAAGFLPWNFPSASIFMGDVGSTGLGFLLAVLAVRLAQGGRPVEGLLPLLPFMLDATITLTRRIVRRERFWQAHRSHFYQRLVQRGRSHATVSLVWGSLAVLGAVAAFVYDSLNLGARIGVLSGVMLLHIIVFVWIAGLEGRNGQGPP